MRRKDREATREEALRILRAAEYGTLSMVDADGKAYGVPISFAVDENEVLYIHGALAGRKIDAIQANPNVSFSAVSHTFVPGPITDEEYKEVMESGDGVRPFLSSHYTTEFSSAIATGTMAIVEDPDEKRKALRILCEKYMPYNDAYTPEVIEVGLSYTNVLAMPIETLTGKKKVLA